MNVLLDTHTFLWWDEAELPAKVVRRIRAAGQVWVSSASAWEVAIKASLGKISAKGSFSDAVSDYGFEELPIRFAHAELVRGLPHLHRDPFDRILVAQAIVEGLTIVSRDALVSAYPVPTVWDLLPTPTPPTQTPTPTRTTTHHPIARDRTDHGHPGSSRENRASIALAWPLHCRKVDALPWTRSNRGDRLAGRRRCCDRNRMRQQRCRGARRGDGRKRRKRGRWRIEQRSGRKHRGQRRE